MEAQLKGMDFLRSKLATKRKRVLQRYKFYDMKNLMQDFDISSPPKLKSWQSSLGWCAKAVDTLNDRLVVKGFKNDPFNLTNIFDMNNKDILISSAIQEALIGACSFFYIAKGDDGFPRIQAIDGSDATGIIDPQTYMLTEGYAVLKRDHLKNPIVEAYFIAGATFVYEKGRVVEVYPNSAPYCALVPLIFKPSTVRPFGHSRISRACMSHVDSALRTIKRGEVASEFYSFPQKWVSGLATDAEIDKWKATMSAMMTFGKDEDGDHPVVGQFAQQSMQPHLDQLKMFASLFAGETGLTLDDMGFALSNPSSAESIKAAHENLRLTTQRAQRDFSVGLLNAGFIAACIRDDVAYQRNELYNTKVKWDRAFELDSSALSTLGDGIIKINQAVPNSISKETISELLGIDND